VGDLQSALSTAFDEAKASPEPASTTPVGETESAARETTAEPEVEKAPEAVAAPQEDEPTGDVLLDKLTPDQLSELKKDPRLRAIYKGLMSSYTPKMQALAEQQRLWDSLNNPETRRTAVEALARAVGIDIKPTDQPQREQAAAVADGALRRYRGVSTLVPATCVPTTAHIGMGRRATTTAAAERARQTSTAPLRKRRAMLTSAASETAVGGDDSLRAPPPDDTDALAVLLGSIRGPFK
jgi:hypothetical protein